MSSDSSMLAPILRIANDVRSHFWKIMSIKFYAWTLVWIPLSIILYRAISPLRLWNRLFVRYFSRNAAILKDYDQSSEVILGFFHPYCDMGGGGERVLWTMIEALLRHETLKKRYRIAVYSASKANKASILKGVKKTFSIDLVDEACIDRIHFIPISSSTLLEAKWYPIATMVGQCIGSAIVGFECFLRLAPDVYVDTMGVPFSYPIFYFLDPFTQILAYVHYPLISSDMLQRVREQRPSYNNNSAISGNATISSVKLVYYKILAFMYGLVGKCAGVVYANSSWTEDHIAVLWGLDKQKKTNNTDDSKSIPKKDLDKMSMEELTLDLDDCIAKIFESYESEDRQIPKETLKILERNRLQIKREKEKIHQDKGINFVRKLYPPCNTTSMSCIGLDSPRDGRHKDSKGTHYILSIGQFRPEKDHSLQLRAFSLYLSQQNEKSKKSAFHVELVLLGSTRHHQDEQLVKTLQNEAENLGISSKVHFVVNASFVDMQGWLGAASVGLHTMWNEHFGISVVEMMAAGLIVVAHNSGGPKKDIITPPNTAATSESQDGSPLHTGYLASTEEEYADCIDKALLDGNAKDANTGIRLRARKSVRSKFSDETFTQNVQDDFTLFL